MATGFAINRSGFNAEPSLMTPTLKGSPSGGCLKRYGDDDAKKWFFGCESGALPRRVWPPGFAKRAS